MKIEDVFENEQKINNDSNSFKTAVQVVSQSLVIRLIAPRWLNIPSVQKVYKAYDVFEKSILEMIHQRFHLIFIRTLMII